MQQPQRVLITGAAGFIGSTLAQRLVDAGIQVAGVDNFNEFYSPSLKWRNLAELKDHPLFELRRCDICDQPVLNDVFSEFKPDAVIHLAAMAGVRPSIVDPDLYSRVNVLGTTHVLQAAVDHGVRKFLFASSSSVYGNNEKVPFAETEPVDHPISPYAATKKAGELICHSYSHLHDLPMFCLRFFTVFGPRQRPDLAISQFLRLVAEGQNLPMFGDGTTSRDYTYVDDIVAGIMAALEKCGHPDLPRYRIFNLGGSEPVMLRDLIETVGQVVGQKPKIDRRSMQAGDVQRTFADITRSRLELGYQPTTDIRTGIEKQWQWMRQQPQVVAKPQAHVGWSLI